MVSHRAKVLVLLVAVIQIAIAITEILLWEFPLIYLLLDYDAVSADKVAPIVANAGLYNGFLAAGLIWGLFSAAKGFPINMFFLGCVFVAGLFGAVTLGWNTRLLQSAPAGLAMLSVWMSRRSAEPNAETGHVRRLGSTTIVVLLAAILGPAVSGEDISPPPILQWFEGKYETMIRRTPDAFLVGYGAVWIPPPGRAGSEGDGGFSVGYDPYDRFDLGQPGHRTKYGTEEGLKSFAATLHRAGIDRHIDFIINHNGTRNGGQPDFVQAGDYPGFVVTLPSDVDGDFHNGLANDWRTINAASVDVDDDSLRNGSAGVKFVSSHDDFGPALDNVAHAYVLMLPGNAIVYFNAGEHGQVDFPKAGRGDALGGNFGDRIVKLVGIRNSHGRGNYTERLLTKELLVFEREGSAVVLLNNRRDSGFDEVTIPTSFAPGTPLVELTGNASDTQIDPHDQVPELVVVNSDGTINARLPRNISPSGQAHHSGYLIYGLAAPRAPLGIELTDVDRVEPAETPNAQTNGTARLSPLHVIKGDSFQVKIKTVEVNLLGSHRDKFADGDNALISIDGGRDLTGDGLVDFRTPGSATSGFERFRDKSSPLIGSGGINGARGDGEFVQTIDATKLENGAHCLEVRTFRHRTDGGPAIYRSFKKVLLVERP